MIADLANHCHHRWHAPPHWLDAIADPPSEATYDYLKPIYQGLAQSRASLQFQKSRWSGPALSRAGFQWSDIESGTKLLPVCQDLLQKSGRSGPALLRAGFQQRSDIESGIKLPSPCVETCKKVRAIWPSSGFQRFDIELGTKFPMCPRLVTKVRAIQPSPIEGWLPTV